VLSGTTIPDEVRAKALGVLREGRLRVLELVCDPNGHPLLVDSIVYGHGGEYPVSWGPRASGTTGYSCGCKDGLSGRVCAHVFALELIAHCVLPHGTDKVPKAKPERRRTGVAT
jgi:hypothetical protein